MDKEQKDKITDLFYNFYKELLTYCNKQDPEQKDVGFSQEMEVNINMLLHHLYYENLIHVLIKMLNAESMRILKKDPNDHVVIKDKDSYFMGKRPMKQN